MARTTDALSGNVDEAEARRQAFLARLNQSSGSDSGPDSLIDQASPSPSSALPNGSVLDQASPSTASGRRLSILEQTEVGGDSLRDQGARLAAEADASNPNLHPGRNDVSGESNGPATSNGGPGQYVPEIQRTAQRLRMTPNQVLSYRASGHSEAGDTIPYAIPGGFVEGAVGRVLGPVGRGFGDLAGAIASRLGRGAPSALTNAARLGESAAGRVGTRAAGAGGRGESGLTGILNERGVTSAAEKALGNTPAARRIGQGIEQEFQDQLLARQRTIPFTTGNATLGGAAKGAAVLGGAGALGYLGATSGGLAGGIPGDSGQEGSGQPSDQGQPGQGKNAPQGAQPPKPTPPPGFHWEGDRLVQDAGTTTITGGGGSNSGNGGGGSRPPSQPPAQPPTGPNTGGGRGPGGPPPYDPYKGPGTDYNPGGKNRGGDNNRGTGQGGGAGAGGGNGQGGGAGQGGNTGGGLPGGNGQGGPGSGPLNSGDQQRQLASDLNDVSNIVRNGPQNRDVQAIFFAQGSKLLDLINQQEQRARAQAEAEGRTIDPATQNTLDTLREQLGQQLKATKETLNSRGLLDSGILIEAEQMLRKGNLSDQAKILAERLSRIQNNLNSQVSQFGQQRVSTAQTFGLAGANAQTQADQSEIDRIEKLRQQMISGRLGLSGQLADQENASAQRDFTAQQNELARQAAFANLQAELAARSNDAEAARQWQARENDLNRQAQNLRNQQTNSSKNASQAEIDLATNNVIAQLGNIPYEDAVNAIQQSQGQPGFENVDWLRVMQSLQSKRSGFKFPWEQ